jgi:hypothetical protein
MFCSALVPWPIFIWFYLLFLYFFRFLRWVIVTPQPQPDLPYVSAWLFSVHPMDAILSSSSMVLSAIRIPIQWCSPPYQRAHKTARLFRPCRPSLFKLLFSFLFIAPTTVYSLPGTQHALVPEASLNSLRQTALRQTVVSNATFEADGIAMSTDSVAANASASDLPQEPFCFIANTDSSQYLVDTGANRVILNDAKLFEKDFSPIQGDVKGVGGNPVPIKGHGTHKIELISDNGLRDTIVIADAVYVPSSPYNLIPPQMLVTLLKQNDYSVQYFKHDDTKYVFEYTSPSLPSTKRTLTVPLNSKGMFTFRSKPGFANFMCKACSYLPDWHAFPGAVHVVPDSDDESSVTPSAAQAREPDSEERKPREPDSQEPREPDSVPFNSDDFDQDQAAPIETTFDTDTSSAPSLDPNVAMMQRKQH